MRENTVRYIVATYQIILLFSAAALAYYGGYIIYLYEQYYHMLSFSVHIIGVIALLSCVLTFVFFIFGCCGLIFRNSCLTTTFSILLGFVLLSELALGIFGFSALSEMHTIHGKYFLESLRMYKSQVGMSARWDSVQVKWDCCGVDYYKNWKLVFENDNLPISCCRTDGSAGTAICTQLSRDLRREGCLNYFGKHIEEVITITASLGIGFTGLQILGIGLSCYAARIFRKFSVYR